MPPPSLKIRQQLTEEELERIEEACDMALELNQAKHRIYEYVESRMSFIAPNLSIIIGASTAAKIMGEAPPDPPSNVFLRLFHVIFWDFSEGFGAVSRWVPLDEISNVWPPKISSWW